MADMKPRGTSESSIQVAVSVEAAAEGRSKIHSEDGSVSDGPSRNRFVRFTFDTIEIDDWVINPATNESHKVIDKLTDSKEIRISTKDADTFVDVPIEEAQEVLLKVVGE
jgi:hypothetical protein